MTEAAENTTDVGGDSISRDEFIWLNAKRTYDAYQDLELERARNNEAVRLARMMNAVGNDHARSGDLVERTGRQAEQGIAHRDVSIDHIWAGTDVSQGAADSATLRALGRLLAGAPSDVVAESLVATAGILAAKKEG